MKIPDSVFWIERAKDVRQMKSDYALAKSLMVSRVRISQIHQGKGQLGPEAAVRMALLIGVEPLCVIASTAFHAEADEGRRGFWRDVFRSWGGESIQSEMIEPSKAVASGEKA